MGQNPFAAIDQQISLDLGGRNSRQLYERARGESSEPLVKQAVDRLRATVDDGDAVLLTTGFPIAGPDSPETDGPLGTAVLAQALAALGAKPIVVVDERTAPVVAALTDELGVDCVIERTASDMTPAGAASLLDRYEPAAVIAVETPGRTADGSYRNMAGKDITALVDPVDELFDRAADRGTLTVAVGDGGNEIGMKEVRSAVERYVDHGPTVACVTPVDQLVVAGVSNWGAYGLVAALSVGTDRQLLHRGETEQRLLEVALEAGAVDGVTGEQTQSVDGIPGPVHARVVDLLRYCCGSVTDQ